MSARPIAHLCRLTPVLATVALLCASVPALAAADHLGTDFWTGFMYQQRGCGYSTCTVPSAKSIWISGAPGTTGSVVAGVPPMTFNWTIPGGATGVSVSLSGAAVEFDDGEHQGLTGVHITASQEVAAYGLGKQQDATEAFTALPTDVLGTKYTLMAWGLGSGGGEFAVIGTQANTTVTITPRVPICAAGPCLSNSPSHAAGVPYTVTLGAGELYQSAALTGSLPAQLDPTGTTISADKPIALMAGNACGVVPTQSYFACEWLAEQLPPDEFWGKTYLTVPLKTQLGLPPAGSYVPRAPDTYKVLASENGTAVRVNGTVVANLNAGDQYDARAGSPQQMPANAEITANRPILVGEFANGQSFDQATTGCGQSFATSCNGDPFFALVPPTEHYLTSYTVPTFSMQNYTNLINLIVPTSAVNAMTIDGVSVPAGDFTAIGSTGFSSAKEGVSNANFHTIAGDGSAKFAAISYGWFGADAYGMPAGQGLVTATSPPPISGVALSPATETTSGLAQKCVTATVTDSTQAPADDVRVDFTVTGANTATGSGVTNASGQTPGFCYTPTAFGTDTLTGAVGTLTGTATKTWTDPNTGGGGGGGTATPTPGPSVSPTPTARLTPTPGPGAPQQQTLAQVVAAAAKEALAGLPSTKKCVSRRHFKIHLRQPKKLKVLTAVIRLQNKTLTTRKGKRYTTAIDLRGYPKGTFVVRITLLFSNGSVNRSNRTYHTCAPKRRG